MPQELSDQDARTQVKKKSYKCYTFVSGNVLDGDGRRYCWLKMPTKMSDVDFTRPFRSTQFLYQGKMTIDICQMKMSDVQRMCR